MLNFEVKIISSNRITDSGFMVDSGFIWYVQV